MKFWIEFHDKRDIYPAYHDGIDDQPEKGDLR
jgi:hypothetical protein